MHKMLNSYSLPGTMILREAPDKGTGGNKSIDDILSAVGDIKKVHTDHMTAFEAFKETNDQAITELKRGMEDVVTKDKLDRINDAMSKQEEALDAFQARMKRIAVYGDTKSQSAEEREQKHFEWFAGVNALNGRRVTRDDFKTEVTDAYKSAFQAYMRLRPGVDEKVMNPDHLKALSVGSDPDGGFVVDPDTNGRIVEQIYETSPMRQYASIQTIGTDALEGLHDTDEASSGWVGEEAARTETNTPQLQKWRIPVHEQYAKPKATQKLLDDAAINMEAWLQAKVLDKFLRTENTAFVTGNGVLKPTGFLSYPDRAVATTFELGAIRQFDTGVNGDFAAAPAGGDVLIEALYGLKQQYRNNATWFMNRSTVGEVRKLKDSDGAYIWQPGIAAGQPASLLGYPQASFEDMPDIATGSLSIAVGDMRAAYQIVDRIGMRVLRDPFSAKPYVEFYSTKRVGGDVLNFEAINLINFQA